MERILKMILNGCRVVLNRLEGTVSNCVGGDGGNEKSIA